MFVPSSLSITHSHPLIAVGLTHASSVIPPVRSNEAESGTLTQLLTPLNDTALPNFPVADHVALASVPLFPRPLMSAGGGPGPSLTPHPPTRVPVVDTVTLPPADGVSMFPLSSPARLLMTVGPP